MHTGGVCQTHHTGGVCQTRWRCMSDAHWGCMSDTPHWRCISDTLEVYVKYTLEVYVSHTLEVYVSHMLEVYIRHTLKVYIRLTLEVYVRHTHTGGVRDRKDCATPSRSYPINITRYMLFCSQNPVLLATELPESVIIFTVEAKASATLPSFRIC